MIKQTILNRITVANNNCWEWTGTVTENGYGQISIRHKRYRPHRVVMHLWRGFDLSSELLVCHKCDNKLCCNPAHLFVGTNQDNMIDCRSKGRLRDWRGSKHGNAKIDEDDILLIRELFKAGWTQPTIAEVFPVKYGNIKSICQRRSWTHVC